MVEKYDRVMRREMIHRVVLVDVVLKSSMSKEPNAEFHDDGNDDEASENDMDIKYEGCFN